MKKNSYLFLIFAGLMLMVAPYMFTSLAVNDTPIQYSVQVVDVGNNNIGLSEVDVYVWVGGGSLMEPFNTASFIETTNSNGNAYFVLVPDFYRICCYKQGYTSDWSNDMYSYAMATGVTQAIGDSLLVELYSGTPSGPDNPQYYLNYVLLLPGIALLSIGLIGYLRRKK